MVLRFGISVSLLIGTFWAAPVHAQSESRSVSREARTVFNNATEAYRDGRYEVALTGFRHAYALTGHHDVLYNIGQSADRLFRTEEAVEAFEAYLVEAEPEASVRQEIEARLSELRAALAPAPEPEPAVTEPEEASVVVSTPSAERGEEDVWWIAGVAAIGAALAVLGIGLVVGLTAGDGGFSPDDVGGVVFTLEAM